MSLHSLAFDDAVLLDEFNHRLFNTINVVSIELARCARERDEQRMRPALSDLGERLQALAALHRLLAFCDDADLLEDRCRAICLLLLKVFGRTGVRASIHMEDLALSREQSIKTCLIVVELVTNCLKHSLTPGRSGTVWIDLHASHGDAELSVCDSLRAPVGPCATPRILKALAESLQAELFVVDRDGYTAGVRFRIRAPGRVDAAAPDAPAVSMTHATVRTPIAVGLRAACSA